MFVRKKTNPSGIVSVQVIDKSRGKYRVVKTIGSSSDEDVIASLIIEGNFFIKNYISQIELDFALGDDHHFIKTLDHHIQKVQLLGPALILGKLFQEIGFDSINNELFRHLVISRLVFPLSKLKTSEYLSKYNGVSVDVSKIYRFLDKVHSTYAKRAQAISYQHTVEVLGEAMSIVFYDVTTLYFESEEGDDLRVAGFSKDGKHSNPQILLGLLVSYNGYPLAYEIFEGNKFEGHTMIPVLEGFRKKFDLKNLVVVADSGLMSKANIEQLDATGHEFILGARLKTESAKRKEEILGLKFEDGQSKVIQIEKGRRLIVAYSSKRARKDEYNRQRGIDKLEKNLGAGRLTKQHINNRGYNKFLKMEGKIKIEIDTDKLEEEAKWDGLKGYITNTKMSKEEIIESYRQLWKIEKAFRISKTDLKIRPIFHRLKRRIESHICIAFCAYKIFKELERQLKEKEIKTSPEKALETMKTIYGLKVILPNSKELHTLLLAKEPDQINLLKAFGF